jgi:peroxiredoxin (alkyl hydroperoxide reductase subunit C)
MVNDLPLGRNIEETLRLLDALHQVDQYGDVCPANWRTGE